MSKKEQDCFFDSGQKKNCKFFQFGTFANKGFEVDWKTLMFTAINNAGHLSAQKAWMYSIRARISTLFSVYSKQRK